ncbi:MAG: uroporphyrinogen-III synthase [Oligoflexales bacterium]
MQRHAVLIWTRSQDEGNQHSDAFASPTSVSVVKFPTTQIKTLQAKLPTSEAWTVAVITSPRTVRVILENGNQGWLTSLDGIYCFGSATHAEILKAGLGNVTLIPDCKTSEQLAQKLVSVLPKTSRILVFGPKQPAYPIADYFSRNGLRAEHISLYETIPCQKPDSDLLDKVSSSATVFVAFASPSAVEGFVAALGPPNFTSLKPKLIALTIGQTTSRACERFFQKVLESPSPDMRHFESFCLEAATRGAP